jgi:uncharacterized phage infection (PIP) family protein YhgE
MADLAKLLVRLEGDNIKLMKSLDQADKRISRFEQSANRSAAAFSRGFKRAVASAAAAVSVFSLGRMVEEAIGLEEANAKAARGLGLTSAALNEYKFAAGIASVSTKELELGLRNLNKRMSEAAGGTKTASNIFDTLGVSVTDASGKIRNVDDVFGDLIDRFSAAENNANRTRIALELFGRAGQKLIPLLVSGREEFARLRSEARRLGLVLDGETSAASERFLDNLTILQAQQQGYKNQLATQLLPALEDLSGLMIELAADHEAVATLGTVLAGVLKGVATTALALGTTFANVGRAIGGLTAAAQAAIEDTSISLGGVLRGFARGGLDDAIAGSVETGFGRASTIIDQFTEDNERATREVEERLGKLWSNGFNAAGQDAAEVAAQMRELREELGLSDLGAIPVGVDVDTQRAEAAAKQISRVIDQLRLQVDTLGMSADAAKRYELGLKGASTEQLKLVESLQEQLRADAELQASLDREAESLETVRSAWSDLRDRMSDIGPVARQYIADIGALKQAHDAGVLSTDQFREALEKLADGYTSAASGAGSFEDQMQQLSKRIGDNLTQSLEDFLFDPIENGFDSIEKNFSTLLRRMAAEIAARELMKQLFKGLTSSGLGDVANLLGGASLGARATGGPVTSGTPYLVGERGPELFVPAGSGTIVPAHDTAASGTRPIVINVSTPNADSFRQSSRQIAGDVKRKLGAT